ncbi:MAG: glycosyltransferase family 39 protein [Nocardioidaceae bacterium]
MGPRPFMPRPTPATAVQERTPTGLSRDLPFYVAAVVLGAALIVVTAIRQPFSYDELTQINVYGSNSISVITGATRQPPIDPLLGALFQHIFGEGQLRQRLVPVLSGIGSLAMLAVLLRHLGLRFAGAFIVLLAATSPLVLRYSAYTRPYALPFFLMLLATYAAQRWLDDRHRGWLITAGVAAFVLPLVRVPEPTVFLLSTAAVLAWFSYRGTLAWSRTKPLIVIDLAALLSMGLMQFFSLSSSAGGFFDPSPSGVVDRFPTGVHELATSFVGVLGSAFPWWPLTLLAVIATLAIRPARERLFGWALWWPLLAAPVAFAIAYHFVNPFPFFALPYRARAASFFAPAFILALAALAAVVERREITGRIKVAVTALLAAVLVGQLPATADVVVNNAAPDFAVISQVLKTRVPADAIVLYDRPTPVGQSRQPFQGTPRYMGDTPFTASVVDIPTHVDELPTSGPVYLLFNGQCAHAGRCVPGDRSAVDVSVPGWKIVYQQERFTLYAPISGQDGTSGVVTAMTDFADALGVRLGYLETYAAAAVLDHEGKSEEAKTLIAAMFAQASPGLSADIREHDDKLDPFIVGSDD